MQDDPLDQNPIRIDSSHMRFSRAGYSRADVGKELFVIGIGTGRSLYITRDNAMLSSLAFHETAKAYPADLNRVVQTVMGLEAKNAELERCLSSIAAPLSIFVSRRQTHTAQLILRPPGFREPQALMSVDAFHSAPKSLRRDFTWRWAAGRASRLEWVRISDFMPITEGT